MLVLFDLIAPLMALIIYTISKGISGWTFEEFLLLQGVLIFVFGISTFSLMGISYRVTELLINGTFEGVLIRPYNALKYLSSTSLNLEHVADIFVGLVLITYATSKLNITYTLTNVSMFFVLVFLALAFIFSVNVFVSSLAFFYNQVQALVHIFHELMDVAQYPLNIYNRMGAFIFSFLLPLGLMAFYPVETLLRGLEFSLFLKLAGVVLLFLMGSLLFWNNAIRHYSSAGG